MGGTEGQGRGSGGSPTRPPPPLISRVSSISSSSSGHLRANSPHAMLIESSFCGPKPIPTASKDVAEEAISLSSADEVERDLIEEINARTKFPITKQDSYGHAIYHGAKKTKNVRKQGSYEAAVESGVNKDIAMRRTKRILKIRKQDSYTRAIGGSFEDEHSQREERRKERESAVKIRKQDSYLKAVGEVSPDTESVSESVSDQAKPGFRKHDSYIEAIRCSSPVDEVPELPFTSSRTTSSSRRQPTYLSTQNEDFLSSERATFRIGDDERRSPRHSPKTSPRRSPIAITSSNGAPKHIKKQDSYTMAIEEESDPEDYIDKEINRKITLKRAETVKTVVKECINENDDILFKIKRRARAEQEAMKRFRVDKENEYNDQMMMEDSNANIQSSRPRSSDRVDNRLEEVVNEFKKSPHLQRKTLEEIPVDDLPDLNDKDFAHAAILIQSAFKGFKVRRELEEMKAFHRNMSQPICEEHSPKPEHRAPEKAGRRQNSYIEAVCSPPDSFADDAPPTKRPWKTRQESYNEAINQQPDGGNKSSEEWKNRQNSYLQAIGTASLDPSVGSSEQQNGKSTNKNTVRQDSYQKAVESQSDKSKSLSEPAYKKRQSSYQKAMSDNSTISESVNQKNIKNSKNKERKDAASKEEKQRKKDVKESDPKLGDKLKKTSHKKQSKSPRRRPEAYQRPPSSSEEEDSSASLKRSHKPRGAGKKQLDKQKSGGKEAKSGATISTFSGAADVVNAAIKIRVAYRGYRARCEIREHHDSVEIGDEEVNEPSNKKDNKKKSTKTERPKKDVNRGAWADVVNSCI